MLVDDVEQLIARNPGLTATQIAARLYGLDGYQERMGLALRQLWRSGRIERRGKGGPGNPFIYHAVIRRDG